MAAWDESSFPLISSSFLPSFLPQFSSRFKSDTITPVHGSHFNLTYSLIGTNLLPDLRQPSNMAPKRQGMFVLTTFD
jgi:hypothetical protein